SGRSNSPTRKVPRITVSTTAPNHTKIFRNRLPGKFLFSVRGARLRVDVADASNCLYSLAGSEPMAQLLAQVADMHVDAAIKRRRAAAEHLLRQLFALDDAAGGAQKLFQQIKLHRREFDVLAVAND